MSGYLSMLINAQNVCPMHAFFDEASASCGEWCSPMQKKAPAIKPGLCQQFGRGLGRVELTSSRCREIAVSECVNDDTDVAFGNKSERRISFLTLGRILILHRAIEVVRAHRILVWHFILIGRAG